MEYIITKASIINKCQRERKNPDTFTENEKPCEEAYLKEILSNDGEFCSRYFVDLESIEDIDKLGKKYNLDIIVSKNLSFDDYIALILYDEEYN